MSLAAPPGARTGTPSLTVVLLTFNEEKHLARAIASVAPIARRIVVVDSHSTDRTTEIARAHGAEVLQHRFVNQAKQFAWALEAAGIDTEWTMRLDADEVIEADLADALAARLPALPIDVTGINLQRKHIFLGRWIRHGGRYPVTMMRLWRTGAAHVEDRWMDEHMLVDHGRTVTIAGGFADHNLETIGHFVRKHNVYAAREAVDRLLAEEDGHANRVTTRATSRSVATKRFLKQRVFNAIPFPLASLAFFLLRYFVQLGFLDGMPGLIYHGLQGFWYRFLVGARLYEYRMALRGITGRDARLAVLAEVSELDLSGLMSEPRDGKMNADHRKLDPEPSP